ncbi:MAG: phosphoribosylglycinamide formyltransferase [Bacillales bacterium]|jgi:phosphoribosylglycinamide formyltransferase-1|nr:phosphoribosylglycinamide formyltransferase [Bacillales bacterium]
MKRIAIFASGNGSNFEEIVKASRTGIISGTVALLVCDKPGALVVEKARTLGIDTFVFSPKDYQSKVEFENHILEKLSSFKVDLITLAGYMRLIGETLLREFSGRIINLHPSLLPKYPGKDAIGQALAAGEIETGITVHFVDEGMDTGPIIDQVKVTIYPNDDYDSLSKKIHEIEHEFFPKVIDRVLGGLVNGD